MQRGFGREEYEPEEERREAEFTLGPAMLLALGLGLILLCGVCFGIGYSVGHRSATQTGVVVSQTASGQTVTSTTAGALSKPSASGTIQAAPAKTPGGDPPTVAAASNPLTSYAPSATPSNADSPQPASSPLVRPAIPPQAAEPAAANPTAPARVEPAIPQGAGIMVQVAAVSHQDDASVLVAALRRRGYTATERRAGADNLIHVQVGPFNSRSEANAMCQKLLSDGYNANIVP